MYEGAVVWLAGEPLGVPFPPEPAAAHADVASTSAAARVKIAGRMALTS